MKELSRDSLQQKQSNLAMHCLAIAALRSVALLRKGSVAKRQCNAREAKKHTNFVLFFPKATALQKV